MADLTRLIDALAGRKEGLSYRALCPVHNGRSLMVRERDGAVLVHCHYGCTQEAVIAELVRLDLWGEDQAPTPPTPIRPTKETLEATYEYRDTAGVLVATKGRFRTFGGKTFRWRLGSSGWEGLKGRRESTLPLYGAHALPEGALVYVVEGEKAADALRDVGLTAVCAAGGASAKDFGQAWLALAGRDVVLWPDNDDPGRGLMRRVHQALDGVAKSIRYLAPEVPERGDAWDYLARGGTVEALDAELGRIRTEPWIDETAGGYLVSIPDAGGVLRFEVLEIEPGRAHALEAAVSVWQEIPGKSTERYTGRLNLTSVSGRESFRRQLDEMFGKEAGWTKALNRMAEMALRAWQSRDPTVLLAEAPEVAAEHLLYPYVLAEEPVVLFGQGGSFKTYLALAWAVCISMGEPFLGSLPPSSRAVLYVDYEASAWRLRQRLEYLLAGMGMSGTYPAVLYWPAAGVPLHDLVPALRRKIRDANIGLVIVDSAALACGLDPEKAEGATRYFSALARLGLPSLSIAHVTKPQREGKAETRFPFGSIFWHNSARATWNIQMDQSEDVSHVGLFQRKGNDDRLLPPTGIDITWSPSAVTLSRADLGVEFEDERSATARIQELLKDEGRVSVVRIAETLSLRNDTVRHTLRRIDDAARVGWDSETKSALWELVSPLEQAPLVDANGTK